MKAGITRRIAAGLGALLLLALGWQLLSWGVLKAVFTPDLQACAAIGHEGACWGVVRHKGWSLLLGYYPDAALWRPALMTVGTLGLVGVAWAVRRRLGWRSMALGWLPWLACSIWLLGGGGPLPRVAPSEWAGLPLTLLLFGVAWGLSIPLAVVLALARREGPVWSRWLATAIVEVARGVPGVALLFIAAFMLPSLWPEGKAPDLVWRAMGALTLFSAVYFAELLRGGLQSIPQEQSEAGAVLGLRWWQVQWRIVLPQAWRAILPASTGHTIGLLKDTSLVMVIGLHELTGGLSLSLGGDADWRPYYFEAYLFVGAVYALMCWAVTAMGRAMERDPSSAS